MRILLVLMVVSFSAIFASGEVLAAPGGMALSEASRRILFQKLPRNAGSALLGMLAADKNNNAWIMYKNLSSSDDKWGILTPAHKVERVVTFDEISTFIHTNLTPQTENDKQLLKSSELNLYIAVSHTPTLLSVYETVTSKRPYEIKHVTHIDLEQGKELFQLPSAFVVEEALEGTDNFPQALEKLFSFYGTDLETFSQQLQAAKNKHAGLFGGLTAQMTGLQQVELTYPNVEDGFGGEAVRVSPSPYISDIDEIARSLGSSPEERSNWEGVLRLLAETELITNDIEVLLQGFDAETAMPQELEQLMQEINAAKTVAEATPAPETIAEKPERKKVERAKQERLPSVAHPYSEFVKQARLSASTKPDGNEPTIAWVTKKLESNGLAAGDKTISNHENFWSLPARGYMQKMIDAGYAELIAVDRETLWEVWNLSQQAWEKEKVAGRFGKLLKKKREAAGYDQRSTMINDLIRDSRGELSQEQFKSLENNFSLYERYKGFPNEATFKQLINAGFADKIGVSAEELETAWREARLARGEAKEMAKEARALAGGEAVTQELPVTAQEPVVEKEAVVEEEPVTAQEPVVEKEAVVEEEPVTAQEPVVEKEAVVEEEPVTAQEPVVEKEAVVEEEAVVEADPTPSSEVASESAPSGMSPVEIENMLNTLQELQEKAPLPSVHELLGKLIEKLEHQWLVEDEQRQARVEKEVKNSTGEG